MPSIEHEQVVEMMAGGLGLEALSVDEQRTIMEASAEMFPTEPDVYASEVDAGGLPADWVTIDGVEASRAILYFHGGGYTIGSRNTHRGLAGRIARAAQARVLLPDYRLAPENPFPAAVEDATACWRWLISKGYAPDRMAIAGDSSGGGLTLATLLALKESGDPLPACAVGLSPWTDLAREEPTVERDAIDDPMLTVEGVRASGQQYAADNVYNPLASPLYGDLQNLPPLLLQVGSREILLSDSTRFAEKAQAAGVEVTIEIEEGLIHVWHMFPDIPEAQSAIERIGAFIKRHC